MGKTGIGTNGNLIPAKKGEVRNPKGKPKGTMHLSTHIQNALNDENFTQLVMDSKEGWKEIKGVPIAAIIGVAIRHALAGEKSWADWLAQYGYGSKLTIETADPIEELLIAYGITKGIDDRKAVKAVGRSSKRKA